MTVVRTVFGLHIFNSCYCQTYLDISNIYNMQNQHAVYNLDSEEKHDLCESVSHFVYILINLNRILNRDRNLTIKYMEMGIQLENKQEGGYNGPISLV